MLIKDILFKYSEKLNCISHTPRLDVEVLISHVMGFNDKIKLLMNYNLDIGPDKLNEFEILFKKRLESMPIAYIINKKEFMGLDFYVDENVLIPRPDTELIVEELLLYVKKSIDNELKGSDGNKEGGSDKVRIIDMCTGSGAIILSCAKISGFPDRISYTGVDISKKALDISKKNAHLLDLEYVNFIESNLFESSELKKMYGDVDIIVSNPPYIEDAIIENLEKDVKDYEPKLALSGGKSGMDFYNKIIERSSYVLKDRGIQ